jgi:hypothetical protein
MNDSNKGAGREQSLPRDRYFTDGYFELAQLSSLSQQIHEIHKLRPTSILEIGIGNGFTSMFLRRAGYQVTTADINPALEPDICAPLEEIERHTNGRRYDLVVCCEVLEHMPFEQFTTSLDSFKNLGDRLFMTLPNFYPAVGFGGFFCFPKLPPRLVRLTLDVPLKRKLDKSHFWEVGSEKRTSMASILKELKARYAVVDSKRVALNPYHIAFFGA